jgi:signal transduction histidine kinase
LQLDNRENTEAQIKSANQDLNHVIEDIRKYIQDLHVGVDYSMTLQEQMDEIAEGFRQVCEARLVVDVARGFSQLTEAKLHAIMQITRESLSNIVRHAHATEVYIDLHPSSGKLNLVISDNGQGFDVARAVMGHGIANIQQRIHQLGGEVELISKPGRGTTLTVKLPL